MQYLGAKIDNKFIGKSYEAEWNKQDCTVTIKSKKKYFIFTFDKFYKSLNFYASLKNVKDAKSAILIAEEVFGVKGC